MNNIFDSQKGTAVYIAVLVIVIVLGIALGLSSAFLSQVETLRGIGRSVLALNAADAGIERILFEDSDNCITEPDIESRVICLKDAVDNLSSGDRRLSSGATFELSVEGGGAIGDPLELADIVATRTSNVTGSGSSRNIRLPTSGVESGDIMFILMSINKASADIGDVLTTPSGWTKVTTQGLPNTFSTPRAYIFKRAVPVSGLGSSVNITSSDSSIGHVAMSFAIQGANETLDVFGTWNTGSSSRARALSESTNVDGTLVFRFFVWDDNDEGTAPNPNNGHSLVGGTHVEQSSPTNGQTVHVYVETKVSVGTTGRSDLNSSSEQWAAVTFAVSSASAGENCPSTSNYCASSVGIYKEVRRAIRIAR